MEVTSIESARTILLANNENYLANALLAKELQQNIHDHKITFKLGMGYLQAKNFDSAKSCFGEIKKNLGSFESYFHFAQACEGLEKPVEAKEAYLDALLISTINLELLFEAYKNLGNIYLREKNLDNAEDFYHKAYALFPNSAQLAVNMGTLEMQKSDSSGAIERFRKALRIDPQFAPAWVGLALSYQQFGDFDMAWASLLKAIEYDFKNSTALLLIAQWAIKQNAVDLSLNHLMNFFDSGEFDSMLSQAFVELCIHANKFNLARLELERSLLWDPRNSDLLTFDKALRDHGY
jgi:tetratricopeptide (TPR) repeat protein